MDDVNEEMLAEEREQADADAAGSDAVRDDACDAACPARMNHPPTPKQAAIVLGVYAAATAIALGVRYLITKSAVKSAIRDMTRQ